MAGAPVLELVQSWLTELDAAGRSRRTLSGHRWHLTDTFTALAAGRSSDVAELELAQVDHEELVAYLAGYRHSPDRRYALHPESAPREKSDYTISRRTAVLRTFCAWATMHGHVPVDPATGITTPKVREHLPRALEVPDAQLIYSAAELSRFPERDLALVAVTLGAGPRLDELAGMRLTDMLGRPPTHIRVLGKGGRERRLPRPAARRQRSRSTCPPGPNGCVAGICARTTCGFPVDWSHTACLVRCASPGKASLTPSTGC